MLCHRKSDISDPEFFGYIFKIFGHPESTTAISGYFRKQKLHQDNFPDTPFASLVVPPISMVV